MNSILSICIPTYNRADYLKESLTYIIPQASKLQIAVYILDNNSSDNTTEVVTRLQQEYKFIFYKCQNENVGLDRNMLEVLTLSTTNYCWWLGDDDIIEPDSLANILEILAAYPAIDFLLLNAVFISNDLKTRSKDKLIDIETNKKYVDNLLFFKDYADKMSFGNLVVDKKQLLKLKEFDRFIGTWHAYSGAILDYLAYKKESFGLVNIIIAAMPMVGLRNCVKTWAGFSAEIYFIYIPAWSKLLLPTYQPIAEILLAGYFNSLTSFRNLLILRAQKILTHDNYKYLTKGFSQIFANKVEKVMRIPFSIAKVLGLLVRCMLKIYAYIKI